MAKSPWSSVAEFERRLSEAFGESRGSTLADAVLERVRGRSPREMVRDRAAATLRRTSGVAALVLAVLSGILFAGLNAGAPNAPAELLIDDPVIVLLEDDATPEATTSTTVLASLLLGE